MATIMVNPGMVLEGHPNSQVQDPSQAFQAKLLDAPEDASFYDTEPVDQPVPVRPSLCPSRLSFLRMHSRECRPVVFSTIEVLLQKLSTVVLPFPHCSCTAAT
jgi:hypothetical protein